MDLVAASKLSYLTPRETFEESRHLDGQVFAAGNGLYLMVGDHLGPNEPIHAVFWTKSDFLAVFLQGPRRTAKDNPFDKSEGPPAPSLTSLGLPDPLEYAVTLEALRKSRGRREWPPLQSTSYFITDGSLVSHEITDGRVTIHYERANPRKRDLPIAIYYELQGPGMPHEVLIAQSERGRRFGIFGRRK